MPAKTFVMQGQRRVTYGEIEQKTTQLASFLISRGVKKGDRVGILSENSPEYISAYFGIQKAGGIAVDINYQYSAREIEKILNHSLPTVVIAERKYLDAVISSVTKTPSVRTVIGIDRTSRKQSLPGAIAGCSSGSPSYISLDEVVDRDCTSCAFPATNPGDIAAIVYTSGTTGEPRGVMLSHQNFVSNAQSITSYLQLSEKDSVMVILPFCYSYGKSLLMTHIMAGGTLILENSFMYPNMVLNKMIEEGVTGFAGVPSTYAILLNRSNIRNYQFPKLRYLTQAGGAMPPQHAQQLQQVFPDSRIYIMYGQTEATARLTYLEPCELVRKAGSIGKAIPGVTIELIKEGNIQAYIGEEGEIVASGNNVMVGYWNNPEETRKALRNGKLFTGDMARMDEEGYLYIVGRRSDMIKSGAHRISPKEIEEVIVELTEVYEVAVVGIDDEILGQAIKAFVVLKDGATLDAKKVKQHCRSRLASFKIPKEVVFVPDLPKTSSGKVRRYELKHHGRPVNAESSGKDVATPI